MESESGADVDVDVDFGVGDGVDVDFGVGSGVGVDVGVDDDELGRKRIASQSISACREKSSVVFITPGTFSHRLFIPQISS